MTLQVSADKRLTFRTVRSPSRPWASVLMLKASDPSPSRMLYAMRALSPRSGSWARSRPTRVPGPAVSTTENWYRPWGWMEGRHSQRDPQPSSLPQHFLLPEPGRGRSGVGGQRMAPVVAALAPYSEGTWGDCR